MTEIDTNWNPAQRVLMGPGPSAVPPRVLQAMAQWTIGHLDPQFLALMDETMGLLRDVYQTSNPLTFPVSGTGSAGMEAAFVNLLEPDLRNRDPLEKDLDSVSNDREQSSSKLGIDVYTCIPLHDLDSVIGLPN